MTRHRAALPSLLAAAALVFAAGAALALTQMQQTPAATGISVLRLD